MAPLSLRALKRCEITGFGCAAVFLLIKHKGRGGCCQACRVRSERSRAKGTVQKVLRRFLSLCSGALGHFFIARLLQSAQNFCIIRNNKHADGESTRRIRFSGRPEPAASERDTIGCKCPGMHPRRSSLPSGPAERAALHLDFPFHRPQWFSCRWRCRECREKRPAGRWGRAFPLPEKRVFALVHKLYGKNMGGTAEFAMCRLRP